MNRDANILSTGDHWGELTFDGRVRSYLVHVPDGAPPNDHRWPLVLAFHGSGTNAAMMSEFSQLNEKADREGFVVVYPNGTGRTSAARSFHAGNCCGYAKQQRVDDIGFIASLLDRLEQQLRIAPGQVFATGMSNGAVMCYELASHLADRVSAIAPVAGPMGSATCTPSQPVSVCHFHGTVDAYAPFEGGRGRRSISKTNFFSVPHSIEQWVHANGCIAEPTTESLPCPVSDGTQVHCERYTAGRQNTEVVLYTIEGGGHTWPGAPSSLRILGKNTANLNANDVMWDFFQRHARRSDAVSVTP